MADIPLKLETVNCFEDIKRLISPEAIFVHCKDDNSGNIFPLSPRNIYSNSWVVLTQGLSFPFFETICSCRDKRQLCLPLYLKSAS